MPKAIDKAGRRYGRLVAHMRVRDEYGRTCYWCICDCKAAILVPNTNLRSKGTRSCGCLQKEIMVTMLSKHGESPTRSRKCTPEYKAWSHAKQRCYNPNDKRYMDYGGRGIKMCDRWKNSYETFLSDMGRRPVGRYSLDRINVHGDYEPNNCRWATDLEQARNKRKYKTLFMVN